MKKLEFDLPEVKLSYKQKLVLKALRQEFSGAAFTREMLDESEDLKDLTMPQLTWALNQMVDMELLNKNKGIYNNKEYTKYSISEFLIYDSVIIK